MSDTSSMSQNDDSSKECQMVDIIQEFLDGMIKQIEEDEPVRAPIKRTHSDGEGEIRSEECPFKVMKWMSIDETCVQDSCNDESFDEYTDCFGDSEKKSLSPIEMRRGTLPADIAYPEHERIKEILKEFNCEYPDLNELDLNRLMQFDSNRGCNYLGLEYFLEFQVKPKKVERIVAPKYYCSLCAHPLVGNYRQFIVNHLRSEKHVLKYLSRKRPNDFKRIKSIRQVNLRTQEIARINEYCPSSRQALLIYLQNLDADFLKCCEKLNLQCKKVDFLQNEAKKRPTNRLLDHDYTSTNTQSCTEGSEPVSASEGCDESESDDFMKENEPKTGKLVSIKLKRNSTQTKSQQGTLLRLEHLGRLRNAEKEHSYNTHLQIFSDSMRFMTTKINNEEEKINFLNDIIKTVLHTVHLEHLSYSLVSNKYLNAEVESLIEDLVASEKPAKLSAREVRSIRMYLERNRGSIEPRKLRDIAIKLKDRITKGNI